MGDPHRPFALNVARHQKQHLERRLVCEKHDYAFGHLMGLALIAIDQLDTITTVSPSRRRHF